VNYALFCINMLLLFFPFDASRMVHILVWTWSDFRTGALVAARVGMVAAVATGIVGLAFGAWNLALLALFGFIGCYAMRKQLTFEARHEADDDEPWKKSVWEDENEPDANTPGPVARWRQQRAERLAERKAQQDAELAQSVDQILAKVKATGMASLTPHERRTLQQATDQKRSS